MPIAKTIGSVTVPRLPNIIATGPSFQTITLDAAGEYVVCTVQAPLTGTLTHIEFVARAISANGTLRGGIWAVPAAGTPGGTLLAVGSDGTLAYTTSDANTWLTIPLTTPVAVTRGQFIQVAIGQNAASAGNLQVGFFDDDGNQCPGVWDNTSGSYAATSGGLAPCVALRYATNVYAPILGCWPFSGVNNYLFSSNDVTADVRGLRFRFPYPVSVSGGWLYADTDGDFNFRLVTEAYNGTDGVLASLTVDKDFRPSNASGVHLFQFLADVTLAKNTWYRLVVEPTTGTQTGLHDFVIPNANIMTTMFQGADWHTTQAKDPTGNASWTNYNNGIDGYRRPLMGLLVNGQHDGSVATAYIG